MNSVPSHEFLANNSIVKLEISEITQIFKTLSDDHKKYLAGYSVKMPKLYHNEILSRKALMLVFLKKHENVLIHKNQISAFVNLYLDITDAQVRHLGTQEGWCVLNKGEKLNGKKIPSGYHVLISSKEPKRGYSALKRSSNANLDFDGILVKYDHCCASCGSRNGMPHRYDTQCITKLEKGHKDPQKALSPENTIPHCQKCNQFSQDKFIFDDCGRVRALSSLSVLMSSSKELKLEALRKLTEELGTCVL